MAIKSFRDKTTEEIFKGLRPRKIHPQLARKARAKLFILDAAAFLEDLKTPPGNRLKALQGERSGEFSIRVDKQWRICFRWDSAPYDVHFEDYH